jgi:hypothetical protein
MQVFNHVCHPDWHKKLDTETATQCLAPPGLRDRRLKEVLIRRAFHVAKDMPFARVILETAMNLERLTLGVEDLGCEFCTDVVAGRPALARSRFKFDGASRDINMLVERLKYGITTSARIEVL